MEVLRDRLTDNRLSNNWLSFKKEVLIKILVLKKNLNWRIDFLKYNNKIRVFQVFKISETMHLQRNRR